jgi:hypothetical protein
MMNSVKVETIIIFVTSLNLPRFAIDRKKQQLLLFETPLALMLSRLPITRLPAVANYVDGLN